MINDYYLSELDLSLLRDFVLSNGVRRTYGKGEYLVCQGERRPLVGLIADGLFRHTLAKILFDIQAIRSGQLLESATLHGVSSVR